MVKNNLNALFVAQQNLKQSNLQEVAQITVLLTKSEMVAKVAIMKVATLTKVAVEAKAVTEIKLLMETK